jgi:hypothetical protein
MALSNLPRWTQHLPLMHASRNAIAAVASLAMARLFQLPEPYWACITTFVVLQSKLVIDLHRLLAAVGRHRTRGCAGSRAHHLLRTEARGLRRGCVPDRADLRRPSSGEFLPPRQHHAGHRDARRPHRASGGAGTSPLSGGGHRNWRGVSSHRNMGGAGAGAESLTDARSSLCRPVFVCGHRMQFLQNQPPQGRISLA